MKKLNDIVRSILCTGADLGQAIQCLVVNSQVQQDSLFSLLSVLRLWWPQQQRVVDQGLGEVTNNILFRNIIQQIGIKRVFPSHLCPDLTKGKSISDYLRYWSDLVPFSTVSLLGQISISGCSWRWCSSKLLFRASSRILCLRHREGPSLLLVSHKWSVDDIRTLNNKSFVFLEHSGLVWFD